MHKEVQETANREWGSQQLLGALLKVTSCNILVLDFKCIQCCQITQHSCYLICSLSMKTFYSFPAVNSWSLRTFSLGKIFASKTQLAVELFISSVQTKSACSAKYKNGQPPVMVLRLFRLLTNPLLGYTWVNPLNKSSMASHMNKIHWLHLGLNRCLQIKQSTNKFKKHLQAFENCF